MKKMLWRGSFLALFICSLLVVGCISEDDSEPYGPEIDIDGMAVSLNYVDSIRIGQTNCKCIDVRDLQLKVCLKSQNTYASKYGINPNVVDKIRRISVTFLNSASNQATDYTESFVVDYYDLPAFELYKSITNFLSLEKVYPEFTLVFTNRNVKSFGAISVLEPQETFEGKICVVVDFENKESYTEEMLVLLTNDEKGGVTQ